MRRAAASFAHAPSGVYVGNAFRARLTLQPRLGFLAYRSYATVPKDLRYTTSHEWVRVDDGIATIGITDHAQDSLGEVVFVDLPDSGKAYAQKESFAAVESVKTVSDVYAPVAGEVVDVNQDLKDKEKVSAINSDPYGNGWMVKFKVANKNFIQMAGIWDKVYSVFFKRTTVYVPALLIGSYYSNQLIDYGVETFWRSKNRGKSFEEMVASRAEA
jgi:glycine cleavage system H protein